MAIIALRAYNREIEGMIDSGQLDEAVAHCRYILATFPKHIASYRLLGKAHLEQQRISDATDIFQRVLTAIPDDFISNVGMSIIREDENNLDASIWHMELAYEAQPANVAIQDELRRLYGRRDGIQPPKVRLTRGALARMYAKGGLYDQAIAELRAAIAEDPNRPDLQQLLAQMFFQTSQRVEAVEICVNLLKKIPLCLEANRILAVSLPEAEGSDAIKNYRQTVIAMEPYYAFAEPDAISSEQVPENAVNIERLDWKSGLQIGETPNQPSWATSLGISMEKPPEENIPDWLKSAEAPAPGAKDEKVAPSVSPFIWDTQEVEKIITDTSKPEGDIPDWMKDAGWKSATGEKAPPFEETKPAEAEAQTAANDELEKADIPDWLQGIVPAGVVGAATQDLPPKEDDQSNPWLEPHQPGPTDSIIQWLEEKKPEATASSPNLAKNPAMGIEDEVPDWLKDLDVPQTTPAQEETPFVPTPAFASEPSGISNQLEQPAPFEAEPSATSGKAAGKAAVEAQPAQPETSPPPAVNIDEVPDWLKEIAGENPVTAASPEPAPELSIEPPPVPEAASTAEMPAAGVVSITDEVPATQLPSAEALPVTEVPSTTEEQAAITTETPTAQIPEIEQAGVAEALLGTALPAAADALSTTEIASVSDQLPSAELAPSGEELPTHELPQAAVALPDLGIPVISEQLNPVEIPPVPEEVPATQPPATGDEMPAAELPPAAADQPQAEQPNPIEEAPALTQPGLEGETNAFAWLDGLIGEQTTKGEELVSPTPEGEIAPPEWVKLESEPVPENAAQPEAPAGEVPLAEPAKDIPEWIKGLGEQPQGEPAAEVTASAVPSDTELPLAEELPAWLNEMEKPEEDIKPPISPTGALEWKEENLPDWLKEISASAPGEVIPAGTEVPPAPAELASQGEPASPIATEPLSEPTGLVGEIPAAEVPVIAEAKPIAESVVPLPELPTIETASQAEEYPHLEPPAEGEPIAEAPALQAVEIPEWIKGLGETPETEKVSEEPAATIASATEEAQISELPFGLPELAIPAEDIKPPITPTGVLEWKEEELPAWLKEITETTPDEEAAATIKALPIDNIPAAPVETSPAPSELFAPAVEAEVKPVEEPQPATGPWVPEVEAAQQPVSAIPVEAPAEPVALTDELTTQAVESTTAAPSEPALQPEAMVSEADQAALLEARNALAQGQPSQALGFYTGLIKNHVRLDEIIKDIKEALYRYPVNVDLWVTLGDAHHHSNDLQEALNAYSKAEELVR